jgi:hypothetical protein
MTLKIVCLRLKAGDSIGQSLEPEITFTALHFCELDSDDLRKLDLSLIERIVSSPALSAGHSV